MKVQIKIDKTCNNEYIAQIYVNGKWFKEIGGVTSLNDLVTVIALSLNDDVDFIYETKY